MKLQTLLKAAGITAIAFLLSYLVSAPFAATLTSFFAPSDKTDFNMSDLFCQIADGRPVRSLEDRIVMLDIGNSNREEIAEQLYVLSLCSPKAVVLDINFELPGDNDSVLIETLSLFPSLVLPLGVGKKGSGFEITDRPFFYESLRNVNYGVVNFPTSGPGSTVREYAEFFPMTDGGSLPSLPLAAAAAGGYPTGDMPEKRGEVGTSLISFPSKELKTISHSDMVERAEEFTDRIVLMGSKGEAGDVYPTPLRRGISGLEIHAYALSTILDGKRLSHFPEYISDALAVGICFLMVLGAVAITSGIKGLVLRLLQLGLLYLLVRIGYWLYVDKGVVADFSKALLMIAFGLFAVDIWNGTVCLIEMIRKRISAIRVRSRQEKI